MGSPCLGPRTGWCLSTVSGVGRVLRLRLEILDICRGGDPDPEPKPDEECPVSTMLEHGFAITGRLTPVHSRCLLTLLDEPRAVWKQPLSGPLATLTRLSHQIQPPDISRAVQSRLLRDGAAAAR